MYVWIQVASFAVACIALALALWPRATTSVDGQRAVGRKISLLPRLWRFPFFWLGLIYGLFVVVQILNPAWRYASAAAGWWLEPIDYIGWLPHGITGTSFQTMDGWRTLLIEGAAWLLVCAIWVGFTRRRSYLLLLSALAINGALVASVILLQRMTDARQMLWLWTVQGNYFAGPFIYKNHGGAYLVLMLGLCLGLAWWHDREADRHFRKSHPGIVYVFLTLLIWVALLFTYARAASGLGTALILFALLAYVARLFWRNTRRTPGLVVALIGTIGVLFLGVCLYSLNTSSVWQRFQRLFKEDEMVSITARRVTAQAAVEMAQPNLAVGHGIGGFRYVFPIYQSHHPEIFEFKTRVGKKIVTRRYYWEHAHNDYAELLAEGGIAAVSLLIAGTGIFVFLLVKRRAFGHPAFIIFLAGAAALVVHASFDFPFHNPAVLSTTLVVMIAVLAMSSLEQRRRIR